MGPTIHRNFRQRYPHCEARAQIPSFYNQQAWTKKNNTTTFDVTMGSFDGAEVCELVGLFILNTLEKRFGKDVGLYRDDGLVALRTTSGRLADKARKELTTIFESFGLRITAQTNIKCVNFLDLTLDLSNGKYKPYRKPNDDDDKLYLTTLTLSAEAGFHNGRVKNINKLLQVK
jgi:hypothetical protein